MKWNFNFCLVSGTTPEDPAVSKSGHVFERRLIEKYITTNGKDPITEEPLEVTDLISLKSYYSYYSYSYYY